MTTCVLFFKQKTAYEMRISDWSSDVYSSDLLARQQQSLAGLPAGHFRGVERVQVDLTGLVVVGRPVHFGPFGQRGRIEARGAGAVEHEEIGSASCRERVCQ